LSLCEYQKSGGTRERLCPDATARRKGASLVVLAIWWVPVRAAIMSKLPVNLQNKLPRYAGQAQVEDEAE
jgi:hypothetical protein